MLLLTGATGYLGKELVNGLGGKKFRCLVRNPSAATFLKEHNCEIIIGDVSDKDSLEKAVKGVDVVIHAAAIIISFFIFLILADATFDRIASIVSCSLYTGIITDSFIKQAFTALLLIIFLSSKPQLHISKIFIKSSFVAVSMRLSTRKSKLVAVIWIALIVSFYFFFKIKSLFEYIGGR